MPSVDFTSSFNEEKAGHSAHYYTERGCVIDCRGNLKISPLSYWGWFAKVFTQTHSIATGMFFGPGVNIGVTVDDFAWVTSCCVLFDCHIHHHAIISIGSVVNGLEVPPYHIAMGNPAKLIARWNGERWVRMLEDWEYREIKKVKRGVLK